MRMLDLFSGIGGISLAAQWAAMETAAFVEIDPFCRAILAKHWPGVPQFEDIRNVTAESLSGVGHIDIIAGGSPCQPFSAAGKQQGTNDPRHMWPEMLRLIGEVKPAWVVWENVANAVGMVLDNVCGDLEGIGYEVQPYAVSAYCSGAWFDGKRVFVVASSDDGCRALRWDRELSPATAPCGSRGNYRGGAPEPITRERWQIESRPYGVADGVPNRVDRIKSLGNAVMPQQIYPFLSAIEATHRIFERELGN